jgi:hypothetical protein
MTAFPWKRGREKYLQNLQNLQNSTEPTSCPAPVAARSSTRIGPGPTPGENRRLECGNGHWLRWLPRATPNGEGPSPTLLAVVHPRAKTRPLAWHAEAGPLRAVAPRDAPAPAQGGRARRRDTAGPVHHRRNVVHREPGAAPRSAALARPRPGRGGGADRPLSPVRGAGLRPPGGVLGGMRRRLRGGRPGERGRGRALLTPPPTTAGRAESLFPARPGYSA